MKRKKYLACLLAMSMMLVSVSPMAVSADAQDVQADFCNCVHSEEIRVY